MEYIALYVNCVRGKFVPTGPFSEEVEAGEWASKQDEPELYAVLELKTPDFELLPPGELDPRD